MCRVPRALRRSKWPLERGTFGSWRTCEHGTERYSGPRERGSAAPTESEIRSDARGVFHERGLLRLVPGRWQRLSARSDPHGRLCDGQDHPGLAAAAGPRGHSAARRPAGKREQADGTARGAGRAGSRSLPPHCVRQAPAVQFGAKATGQYETARVLDLGTLTDEETAAVAEQVELTEDHKLPGPREAPGSRPARRRNELLRPAGCRCGRQEARPQAGPISGSPRIFIRIAITVRTSGSFGPWMGTIFEAISQAFDVLSDPRLKSRYDAALGGEAGGPGATAVPDP